MCTVLCRVTVKSAKQGARTMNRLDASTLWKSLNIHWSLIQSFLLEIIKTPVKLCTQVRNVTAMQKLYIGSIFGLMTEIYISFWKIQIEFQEPCETVKVSKRWRPEGQILSVPLIKVEPLSWIHFSSKHNKMRHTDKHISLKILHEDL